MTTNFTMRIDRDLKKEAEALFEDLGMSLSTAFTVFLKQALRDQGMPFLVERRKAPSEELRAAMAEADDIRAHPGRYKSYSSFQEILDEVDAEIAEEVRTATSGVAESAKERYDAGHTKK